MSYVKALLISLVSICFSVTVMLAMLIAGKRVFHPFARGWSRILLAISGIRVRSTFSEEYKKAAAEGANFVFAANHSNYYDIPVILASAGQNANIVYKKSLADVPIWGWGLRMSPFIPVDRSSSRSSMVAVESALEKIKQGDSVIIFPEGMRTRTGDLNEFKRGAFMMAARSGLPIVPVAIKGTYRSFVGKPFQVNGGVVEIIYGVPYTVEGEGSPAEKQAMHHIHSEVARMLGDA